MELVKVGEKTYYIKDATNIGIYKVDDSNVYFIDTGNDKDAGKKILKIIDEQGWNVKGIITMNANQYVLVGSAIKSYLSYLYDENKLCYEFRDNKMVWKQIRRYKDGF